MYLEALDARTRGQTLERVTAVSPFVVRSVEPPFSALAGRSPLSFALIGKRLVVGFEGDLFLVMHLMVSGRLQWHTTRPKIHRRLMMAVFDFPAGTLMLTEAGTKRRASIYVVRGAAALEQFAHGGLDPMAVTDTQFAARVRSENHTLKRTLTDPRLFQRNRKRVRRRNTPSRATIASAVVVADHRRRTCDPLRRDARLARRIDLTPARGTPGRLAGPPHGRP